MKNRTLLLLAIGLVTLLALGGCKTLSPSEAEKEAIKAVGYMNSGSSGDLSRMCRNPMLFETEILSSEKIILSLWEGLDQAGYDLENPKIMEISKAGPDSYTHFADTWEASVFFKRYLPETSYLVKIGGDGGREILLMINGVRRNRFSIFALRVVK